MNQFFVDELRCVSTDLRAGKYNPRFYCGNEINIIGDENALAAYLAGFNMSVLKANDGGLVNVILEGECRNKNLYDEIEAEYGSKECMNIVRDFDEYLTLTDSKRIKRFYYIANLQLPEYKEEAFVEAKLDNLNKWLDYAMKNNGRFIFIPVFNFANPFPNGVAAISEREVEAIA